MVDYPNDALAVTVRIKDKTSCANNRALLHRIKNNDPSLTYLYIVEDDEDDRFFSAREGDDLGWLGYFIGENETLKSLYICYLPAQKQIKSFFIGLQRNKSIKRFDIDGDVVCLLGEGLSAINLPHVTSMTVEFDYEEAEFDHEKARHFAVGLRRCESLVKYYGPMTSDVVTSLALLPMLEDVAFWRNINLAISPDECMAMSGLLTNATNMKQLDLCCTALGNEGLAILAEGLACNASLIDGVLDLSDNGIGDEGVQVLASSLASNTKLRELVLADNNIGDVGVEALADLLAQNRALRVLSLARNTAITANGMRSVSRFLRSSGLKDLRLDGINLSIEGWNTLADALSVNKSVVSLSLKSSWDSLGIGDDALRALAVGLSHNCLLKTLDLSGNTAVTASGLRSLKEYFRSPSCALKDLNLFDINISDKSAHALADALFGNKSLLNLRFGLSGGITSKGWKSFLTMICDSSSPNSLYLSNHTIRSLSMYPGLPGSDVRKHIARELETNKVCQTPKLAAKSKILRFFPDLDMVPLFQWNLKLLPLLKTWLRLSSANEAFEARIRNSELSCIYKFVRGLPVLIVDDLRRNLTRKVERIRAKISKLEEEERRLMQG